MSISRLVLLLALALTACELNVNLPTCADGGVDCVAEQGTHTDSITIASDPTDPDPDPDADPEPAADASRVECIDSSDCPADRPQCGYGVCSPCSSDAACTGRAATPFCITEARAANEGECVECAHDDDCPAGIGCGADHHCGACDDDRDCAHVDGHPHCNARPHRAGFCTECTSETEVDDCGATACASGTCTDTERASRGPCEPCQADSECEDGAKCVHHMRGGFDLGTFCFYANLPGGCADTNLAAKPFSETLDATSVDGVPATFCVPRTSCEALDDASNVLTAGIASCERNSDCGAFGISDGLCAQDGPSAGQCVYGCTSDDQCPVDLPDCDETQLLCVQ